MKKVLFVLLVFSLSTVGAQAKDYTGRGLIYSGSSFPQSAAHELDGENPILDLAKLKVGESKAVNILGLVETGDASVQTAAKNGGIDKIRFVDSKVNKVYIPLLFIPIYAKQKTTVVYGE